ncbi:MAG: hypothetical protein ACT4QD_03040 [Acidobacteriota bacterium]
MSNKTRYFVLGAGAVLAIGLTTGVVASLVGMPIAFSQAAGPDELQYVPPDAAVVAYANVHDMLQSSLRERFRRIEPDTQAKDEFQKLTGVDIEQDIQSVVAAMMPGSDGQGLHEAQGALIVARGRFEPTRLEALAMEHGATVEDYQGKRIIVHAEHDGSGVALGFLEADVIAFGGYPAVKRAIDAGSGTVGNIVSNTELMQQIDAVDGSSAWAVGRFDVLARSGRLPSELQAQMPAITWFSAAAHVNGGLNGVFKAEARDEQAAQNVRDLLRGFLALAKIQGEARPEFKVLVDSLQLTGEGRDVALSFTLPAELLDALEALSGQRRPGARQ